MLELLSVNPLPVPPPVPGPKLVAVFWLDAFELSKDAE